MTTGPLGAALVAAAMALVAGLGMRRGGPVEGWLARYEAHLRRDLGFLLFAVKPAAVARGHAVALTALAVLAFAAGSLAIALVIVPAALAPSAWLSARRAKRITAIEQSLPGWLVALANALRVSPALGDALRLSRGLAAGPLAEEIDLVLKSLALGTPLDSALRDAAERVASPVYSSVIASLLVGRQTGGQLPALLEQAAATLREMERLEGVVRTKTAEGKTQAYVLAAIPFVVSGALQTIDDGWLAQFTETTVGMVLLGAAITLWAGSIVAARKILRVDI